MDLQKFIKERPFLYHLTSERNANNIIKERTIYSANALIDMTGDKSLEQIKRSRRITHQEIKIGDNLFSLRDQKPISEKALGKCLTDNWSVGDFLYHLNDRVFMWPTLDRLWRHFNRYEQENPIIFRFSTPEILESNPHVKFCRLNSGATRANSYLGGTPPQRGSNSFMPALLFEFAVREVAEVTFENKCVIDGPFWKSFRPDEIFVQVS